ncbi:hypothetical protein [Kistimonas asteriae]|uniref:hypothetical protein n=1 Tax=Kistimonas asteriae TaxID=517724 RepID=UPI001BA59A01|nr:hypothetical protein [Kistimonas asteriae]
MLFTGILFGIHDCGEFIVQRENQGNIKHRFFHSPCKKVFKAIKHINEKSALIRTLSSHFRPLFYVLSYTGTLGTGLGDMFQHKYNDLYKTEEPTVVDHLSSGIILTLLTVSALVYFLWVCYKEKHKGQAYAISPPAMEEQADTTRAA